MDNEEPTQEEIEKFNTERNACKTWGDQSAFIDKYRGENPDLLHDFNMALRHGARYGILTMCDESWLGALHNHEGGLKRVQNWRKS